MSTTAIFRELHNHADQPLLLANIWDVGGARLVESLGAKAVATTSAGVAWSLGYQDGNQLPLAEQVRLASALVKAVKIPVSIDMEAGYSDDPSVVGENLKELLDVGIAGINIEDGTDQPSLLAKKIEAIKRVAVSMNADLFINARTDVFLQNLAPDGKKVDETLTRAAMYGDAGADGLFVPGTIDPIQIAHIILGTQLPLNVLAWPGLRKSSDLAKLGVRRVSAGSGIAQAIWHHIAGLAENFLAEGDADLFAKDHFDYGKMQTLFANRSA